MYFIMRRRFLSKKRKEAIKYHNHSKFVTHKENRIWRFYMKELKELK